ncbi:unnamed protein product [Rangifer tarandus platyrhynchus]|uniref:Uncharacterized protein n=2 Tax=Rangifer tarandus platyrhynchus TaxID=3082113 RepID=A0ACB0F498_RANTA|nr:unnamed protein product [Rangifer tarandus platyrhynchus]CAI9707825.1 unnamed protein product [Rangifer tarandus platyrhynchus]
MTVQRPNTTALNQTSEFDTDSTELIPALRGPRGRIAAHTIRVTPGTRTFPTPPSGLRHAPEYSALGAPSCSPTHPSPAGYAARMRGGGLAAAKRYGKCSLRAGAGGPPESYVFAVPGEVRTASPQPGPRLHLHTCPVTSRSRPSPTRWASVRAGRRGEPETRSSLQRAVLEEAGSTARLPPPPSPPPPLLPGGRRAGARRAAAAPAAAAGGAAAAAAVGAAGDAPARLLRRGAVRAAAAAAAAAGEQAGGGGCHRGAENWRRRRRRS